MNATAARSTLDGIGAQLSSRWWQLPRRDRRAVLLAALVVLLALVWFVAVAPALATLRRAPAELDALDLQLQRMQQLAVESRELRATPPVGISQATAALNSATTRLGKAGKLSIVGDRATLTLTNVESAALRAWLNDARAAARARPVEAQLSRSGRGYSGTVIVSLGGAA